MNSLSIVSVFLVVFLLNSCSDSSSRSNDQTSVLAAPVYQNGFVVTAIKLFDSAGLQIQDIQFRIDEQANIIEAVDTISSEAVLYQRYIYSDSGQLLQRERFTQDGASLDIVNFEYDARSQLIKIREPSVNGDFEIDLTYDDAGRLEFQAAFLSEDEIGLSNLSYQYNTDGNIESVVQQFLLTDTSSVATYEYEQGSSFYTSQEILLDNVKLDITRTYQYDSDGNIVQIELFNNTGNLIERTEYLYKTEPEPLFNLVLFSEVFFPI